MSTTRLPELPFLQPTLGYAVQDKATRDMIRDYARAYGLAVWKAAMEAAAKECDGIEAAHWKAYKRGTRPERGSDYVQGQSDCANECATAIRSLPDPSALPLPEQGSPQERRE